MGLDDFDRGSDVRFPGVTPRTDFASQIEAGKTAPPPPGGDTMDESRLHRLVFDAAQEVFTYQSDTYHNAMPEEYERVRYDMKEAWGFDRVSSLNYRTDWAAQMFYNNFGRWPKAYELAEYEPYMQALNTLRSGDTQMPSLFRVDGTAYYNHPMTGPRPINEGNMNTALGPGGIDAALESGELNNSGVLQVNPDNQWSFDQFDAIRQSLSPISGGGGGGGGGGGAGRAPAVFDRAQLEESALQRWRGLLLEEPDEGTLTQLVSDYIAQANAFWMNDGGRLDYDTYVVNKVRATDRHTYLYAKKAEFQSEEEYMGGFRQTVGQFGLGDRAALRETEAGAHSGVGLAGFGERVGRTSEARLASTGSYSQRFAASMAQSGLGRT